MKLLNHLLYTTLVLSCSAVNAISISYSDSFSTVASADATTGVSVFNSFDQDVVVTNTDTVNLQGFDAGLGTLTGVDISFTSDWTFDANLTAEDTYTGDLLSFSDTSAFAQAWSDLTVSLDDPSSSQFFHNSSDVLSCAHSTNELGTAACGDSFSLFGSFDNSLDLSSFSGTNYIDFIGIGNIIDLSFENLKEIYMECDGNITGDFCTANASGSWDGDVTITYTYDAAVPEPGVFSLLMLGLLGMIVKHRKYRIG